MPSLPRLKKRLNPLETGESSTVYKLYDQEDDRLFPHFISLKASLPAAVTPRAFLVVYHQSASSS